ncbi:MAG: hypothetical protein QJT81_12900 [Candidatus Thiothrix putei]|uniref:Uncharacterized protein n=1 Tax=Candidatus Thiothrix putei TaxID=3080811 RepID=A0AA95KHQ9_9GAMM|nr:MAG: hypothetical protein QJT81_12900 [Candidatus Thiothrix putei]
MNDNVFPGSVSYFLAAMSRRMRYLPDPEMAMTMAYRVLEHTKREDVGAIPAEKVHTLMDYLQSEITPATNLIAR